MIIKWHVEGHARAALHRQMGKSHHAIMCHSDVVVRKIQNFKLKKDKWAYWARPQDVSPTKVCMGYKEAHACVESRNLIDWYVMISRFLFSPSTGNCVLTMETHTHE